MARTLPILAVVACIALSGCAGVSGVWDGGPGDARDTETVALADVERNPETSEWNLTYVMDTGLQNATLRQSWLYVDGNTSYSYDPTREPAVTSSRLDDPMPPLGGITMESSIERATVSASHALEREDAVQIVYDVMEYYNHSASGRLVIDERGVLREFTLDYTEEDGTHIVSEISVTPEAPDIERPEWVPRANGTSTTTTASS